jgi:hypothetical protein
VLDPDEKASIMELENATSTWARTRSRHALIRVESTARFTFSTPESAYRRGCAEQGQQESNNGGADSRSAIDLSDGIEQVLPVLV